MKKAKPAPAEVEWQPGRLAYWLLPNLSTAVGLAALYYCAAVYFAPERFFGDADAGWHIRAGEWILREASVPRTDIFSYLPPQRWYAWEWLAEVAMAAVHRAAGMSGVVFAYLLVVAGGCWLWFRLHWKLGGGFLLACAMAAPMVSAMQVHWLARPHQISFLFLLGAVWLLEGAGGRFGWKTALTCFAGAALWTNIHGSFVVGLGLAGLYAAGHFVRGERETARWCALAGLAASAGTLANPYGLELHGHVLNMVAARPEMHMGIVEWEPYPFNRLTSLPVVATLLFSGAGAVAALAKGKLHRALAIGALTVLALQMARGIPVNAMVSLPLANAALTELFRKRGASAELKSMDAKLSGAALLLPAVAILWWWLHLPHVAERTGFTGRLYPVRSAHAVAALPEEARVLAGIVDAGAVIYLSEGRRKMWVDPRVDYFGPERLVRLHALLAAAKGWEQVVEQEGFTHALLRNEYPLAKEIERAGWKKIEEDSLGALWRK